MGKKKRRGGAAQTTAIPEEEHDEAATATTQQQQQQRARTPTTPTREDAAAAVVTPARASPSALKREGAKSPAPLDTKLAPVPQQSDSDQGSSGETRVHSGTPSAKHIQRLAQRANQGSHLLAKPEEQQRVRISMRANNREEWNQRVEKVRLACKKQGIMHVKVVACVQDKATGSIQGTLETSIPPWVIPQSSSSKRQGSNSSLSSTPQRDAQGAESDISWTAVGLIVGGLLLAVIAAAAFLHPGTRAFMQEVVEQQLSRK